MHVNKTKFERNSSLEFYHMTCIGKTKHTSYDDDGYGSENATFKMNFE